MEGDNECPEIIANFCISIHSLRMEGDVYMTIIYYNYIYFNPLPPHGGRPCKYTNSSNEIAISIHSLRMEGDAVARKENFSINRFQSTPSAWRETLPSRSVTLPSACHFNPLPPHGGRPSHRSSPATPSLFQSTPSAWRETIENKTVIGRIRISIHSLRMEGDMTDLFTPSPGRYFNPLPPHGGRHNSRSPNIQT